MSIRKKSSASTKQAWRPNPNSLHYKIYKQWLRHRGYLNYEEDDFYRYWRIICIWSPIEAVKPLLIILIAIACLLGVTGLAAFAVIELVANNGVVLVVVGFLAIYCLLGIIAWGVYLWSPYNVSLGPKIDNLMLPAMAMTGIFVFAGKNLAIACTWLWRLMMGTSMGKLGRRLYSHPWVNWWQLVWLLPLAILLLGFWHPIAWAYLLSGALIISFPGAILLTFYLSERSDKLQSMQLQQTVDNYLRTQMGIFLRRLYELQHPKYAHDDKRFKEWLKRYTNWFYAYVGHDKSAWFIIDRHLEISKSLKHNYQRLYGPTRGQINSFPATAEFLINRRSSSRYDKLRVKLFGWASRDTG